METREENSPDWPEARRRFEEEPTSFRRLGEFLGKSHTAVAKVAKKEGWKKFNAEDDFCKPHRKPVEAAPSRGDADEVEARSPGVQSELEGASVTDLTKRGRNLILDLMAELEFLNRNHQTLVDIVEAHVDGNEREDRATRAKLIRSLDHETRAKTANNLATALAKLNDATPGKKQLAEEGARTAGQGSSWGDDLESGISGRPN